MEKTSENTNYYSAKTTHLESRSAHLPLQLQQHVQHNYVASPPVSSEDSLSVHKSQNIVVPLGGLTASGLSQITGTINSVCPIGITTSTSRSQVLSMVKESPSTINDGVNVNQPIIHPCILGNVAGANLLSANFLKKDGGLQTFASSVSLNGQLIDIVPFIIQNASGEILQTSKVLPSVITDSVKTDATCSSLTHNSAAEMPLLGHSKEGIQATVSNNESDSSCKIPLASSDTLIISAPSLVRGDSDTLPLSSLSQTSTDSFITKLLVSDKSVTTPSLERPYSLLANISDRSVSLESISSIDLLKADPEKSQSCSMLKSDPVLVCSESVTVGPQAPHVINLPQELAVIGDDIPPSLVQLLKPQKNNIHTGDPANCLSNAASQFASQLPYQTGSAKKCIENLAEETSNDTDTAIQSEDEENQEEKSLSRSDTIILTASEACEEVTSKAKLLVSDTILLSEDTGAKKNKTVSLSDGCVNSLSTDISSQMYENDSAVDRAMATPRQTLTLTSESPSDCSTSTAMSVSHQQNKTLYMVTADGQLAILGYVPANHIELLSRPPSISSVLPQVQPQFTTVSQIQEVTARTVDAKETQTELVFGTNTVFFRPVDATSQCSIYAVDQPPNIRHTEPLTIQSSTIPATVVFSQSPGQLHQPHSCGENFQRTGVSLTVPTTVENITGNNLQAMPQECSIVPPQTLESKLPCSSSVIMVSPESSREDTALFSCLKCQEKFQTKQALISHEKNHKKGYKCDLCNATFTRMGNYNRHRKIHNLQHEDQISFKCNDCGREFLQRCDLKRHLLIHTKQEPHRCEKCGKGYIRHSDLVVHMRFHNKEKAFSCSLCDKKFFQSGDLNRHVRRAHKPNSQLTCGHCDRKYACETTLIRHMKAVHKDIILHTVNKRLQESGSGDKDPVFNTKDVLFTMSQQETDS